MTKSKKPNIGITLLLNMFVIPALLGIDRFYTGNKKAATAMLVGSLTIVGLLVTLFVAFMSNIFLIFSALTNREYVLLYGQTQFEKPTRSDKIIAIISIIILLSSLFVFI